MSQDLMQSREGSPNAYGPRLVFALVGIALAIHGAIHAMGVMLLLELGEPGDLTYAVARPEPGTTLAVLFAALWALAAALFVAAGFLVFRGRPRVWMVVVASVASLAAIAPMAAAAPVGFAISLVTLTVGTWYSRRTSTLRLR